MTEEEWEEPEAVEVPIDGTLDLHTFHPRDLKECVARTIWMPVARRAFCRCASFTARARANCGARSTPFWAACLKWSHFAWQGEGGGGWGATLVWLAPLDV